ncbi:hypothetical protein L6R52_21735 [Myxococcota bacterium]|nr:hypothetical protein [Myxococcota bacterium]
MSGPDAIRALPEPEPEPEPAIAGPSCRIAVLAICAVLAAACGEEEPRGGGRPRGDVGVFVPDAGATDASPFDSGKHADAAEPDAGDAEDAGVADVGSADVGFADVGFADAGSADAGFADVGFADATPFDAGVSDTGLPDTGLLDTGLPDTGPPDTGPWDSGVSADSGVDAGAPGTGDIWVEIDYRNAFSPRSPSWSYSATPGWGEPQWATSNGPGWPEAWDRFNNMQVVNDPIGTSLEIGSSSELQLMIGLEELISYQYAVVHLEGRSRATSSQVTFDVYNPWTSCGDSGLTMAQDWSIHAVDADLGTCYVAGSGGGVQAVRVDPTNGTIALTKLRLTLYGARW